MLARKIGLWLATFSLVVLPLAIHAGAQDAANVAGTWEISSAGPRGNTMTQTLTIEQDGANIKGSIQSPRGTTPFTGTVSGNNVSWTVQRQGRDGQTITIEYKGTVDGDTIKGSVGMGQRSRDFTATRKSSS